MAKIDLSTLTMKVSRSVTFCPQSLGCVKGGAKRGVFWPL